MNPRTRTRPANAPREQIAARLHSVAIHLLRSVRRDDPAMGLSPARASALSVLVFGGPRAIGELAAAEQVSAPTMTRLVAGLESDGYVRRSANRADARVVHLQATAKGRKALEGGRQRRIAHVIELLRALDDAGWAAVDEAVGLIENALEGPDEPLA
jgi:DNA-binding MarR family transcriptional regulator